VIQTVITKFTENVSLQELVKARWWNSGTFVSSHCRYYHV